MSTQTVEMVKRIPPKKRFNRFDSPWLNRRFITGIVMIGLVIVAGLLGPIFWDTNLSLVGSSPLNLPPMWVHIADTTSAPNDSNNNASNASTGNNRNNPGANSTTTTGVTPTKGGFGGSGLSGSGLVSLMSTGTPAAPTAEDSGTAAATATATPRPILSEDKPSGTSAHPLGTDNSGRDILAVLIVGGPASLRIGVIAAVVGLIVSIVLGFTAGFLGGWVDAVIRTISDVAVTIPSLAVLLVISAYLHSIDLNTMALLLSLFSWPAPTRLIRAQVLTLRERGYVRMAQLSGQSTFSIMFREMLPNMLPYLAASLAGNISGAILAATSLEALGLGPTRFPTLGTTLFNALRATAIMRNMYWWWGFPVLMLAFIFTGLFQIATGLDEIANPRLRGTRKE